MKQPPTSGVGGEQELVPGKSEKGGTAFSCSGENGGLGMKRMLRIRHFN